MLNRSTVARGTGISVALVFLLALLLSIAHGHGRPLPSIALGWPLLFHLERATALAALVGGVFVVVLNLLRGELPTKVSTTGVEWSAVAAPDRAVLDALVAVAREMRDAIEELSTTHQPRVREPGERLQRLDSAVQEAERRDAIADAIGALPDRQKMVIALHYYEGLEVDEIAKVLHASPGTVQTLRFKALAEIRKKLGGDPTEWLGR